MAEIYEEKITIKTYTTMAVTPEFINQVAEALDELGYSVETEQDVIDDVSELNDDVTLPGIRQTGGVMTGYVSMKLAVLYSYLQGRFAAIQSVWNSWFGTDATTGVQGEWGTLKTDAQAATTAANNAATNANSKATQAETAAGTANTAAIAADNAADNAGNEAAKAKNMNDHPAYIGDDDYWYFWDYDNQEYVKGEYARGAAATIAVGSTSTLNPDQQATVVNTGTAGAAVFNFAIPRGAKGEEGKKGDKGDKGDDLDYSTMTPAEKQQLYQYVADEIAQEGGYVLYPVTDADMTSGTFRKNSIITIDGVTYKAIRDTTNLPVVFVMEDGKYVTQVDSGINLFVIAGYSQTADWEVWIDASNNYRFRQLESRVTRLETLIQ